MYTFFNSGIIHTIRRIDRHLKSSGKNFVNVPLLLLLLLLFYLVTSTGVYGVSTLFHPYNLGAFWSPDSGARFAMIRNWTEHGQLLRFSYPYADIDPSGKIHPLAYFLFHRRDSFTSMYPPLFPFLCGLCYCAFGFAGLTLVPSLCGVGCVAVTYLTAAQLGLRSRFLLVPVLGLATPLLIYSSVFWDHSGIMLVVALVSYWLLKSIQTPLLFNAFIAGAMVGLGMWLHEQFLALFVAVWLASLPLLKQRPYILPGLTLGFASVVLLWGTSNWWLYGTFIGPHLAANVFQNNADHPFSALRILNIAQLINRSMVELVGTGLPSFDIDTPLKSYSCFLTLACLLIIYALWSWDYRGKKELAFLAIISAAVSIIALFLVFDGYGQTAPSGLFQATPLLVPGLAVPWLIRHSGGSSYDHLYFTWLSRACFLFLLFLLINPMYPGADWGSRYLLSALPMMILLSAYVLEKEYETLSGRWRPVALFNVVCLIGTSTTCQILGLCWVHRSIVYDQDLSLHLNTITAPVLVTDTDFNARLAFAPPAQARFLVRSDEDERLFATVLCRPNIYTFCFVGSESGAERIGTAISYSGRSFKTLYSHSFFALGPNEVGDELVVSFFSVFGGHVPARAGSAKGALIAPHGMP